MEEFGGEFLLGLGGKWEGGGEVGVLGLGDLEQFHERVGARFAQAGVGV